jgi:phospholipase/lecithinase/hemolysin
MLANGEASNIQLENTISFYNNLISTSLASFKSKNSGVTSWVVDTTAPFNEAINNPSRYGAPDATCYNSDGKSCLWKDNYHPGIEIQKLVAAAVAKAVGQPWFA